MSDPLTGPPERDYEWRCNSCTFRTRDTSAAMDHVTPRGRCRTWPAIVYERREREDESGKPVRRRRIVWSEDRVQIQMNPKAVKRR